MKTRKRTFFVGSSTLKFESELPLECPHCSAYGVPSIVASTHVVHKSNTYHLLILEHSCCDKISQAIYRVNDGSGELLSLLPQIIKRGDFPDSIKKISPHFIELYNQCYEAEQRGFLELAGSGYRNALEVLIKDYAISVLHEPEKEVISCSLSKATKNIFPRSSYLNQPMWFVFWVMITLTTNANTMTLTSDPKKISENLC